METESVSVFKRYELPTLQPLTKLTSSPIRARAHESVTTENLGKPTSKT